MIAIPDIAPIYDFSLIEKAVQSFFCSDAIGMFVKPPSENEGAAWDNREKWLPDGAIPFFTAFESLIFQKHRPRVGIDLQNIVEIPAHIIDADDVLRAKAWRARMQFGIVTALNYTMHTQLRAAVAAIIPQLQPTMAPDGSGIDQGGVNKYLAVHEMATFSMTDNSTRITPQDGNYFSPLNCTLTFSVRATAWPGGTKTT